MRLASYLTTAVYALALVIPSHAVIYKQDQVMLEGIEFLDHISETRLVGGDFPEYWFNQKRDHYSKHAGNFKQRYFLNDTYYKPGGPILLYAPGESTARPIGGGLLRELAKTTKGLMVSLEHRYYGKSLPTQHSDVHGMRFLTVDNALADMAYFIQHVKIPGVNTKKAKWAVIGGSYGGVQAAWMRQAYPKLVHAALASSAPVQIKEDFYEYDLALTAALPCSKDLHKITRHVDQALDSGNRTTIDNIKELFGLQQYDDENFIFAYGDSLGYLVQYSWPQKDPINAFCKPVTEAKTLENKIRAWGKYINRLNDDFPNIAQNYDDLHKKPNHNDNKSWYWQICSELGYFQTAPRGKYPSVRSQRYNLKLMRDFCKQTFGKPMRPNVAKVNRKHHGWNIKTTRIHFTDGEIDPWRRLSVNAPNAPKRRSNSNNPLAIIENGSHCTDLYSSTKYDWESLLKARESTIKAFKRWLL
ncbi:uncharacterized protein VTP21DRAFT_4301 [Calcarisporiella thermophila]|uniref:uncharacterized protein n=1 Tax=Calcarisporiella thermophila TaxID=911321 RepID=UPI003742D7E4